jgi:acyl-CoA synthetase (AMP-forming)/AMP-acid ligase II
MKSIGGLSDFAARLRRVIRASTRRMPPRTEIPPGAECQARPGPWRACLTDAAFNSLALELFGLQFEHNAPYRRLCQARNASPEDAADWSRIPAAPTAAFKELELSCLPPEERTTVFYSSGTTGQQRSRHFHNGQSLALYRASLTPWFEANVMDCGCGIEDWQLSILAPAPEQAPHSSLVHMFETVRRRLGSPGSAFLGQAAADGAWSLDLEAATAALESSVRSARPLLLLGTAFMFVHLLDHLAKHGLELELPPRSRAMETGGYKGRSRAMPAGELRALITRRLGIPPARIIREYGMSELSSQAYAPPGAPRAFRFPAWARVKIISPETGREAAEGETGLLRVFDLANVFSVLAVQTEDLAVGRADGFELLGRAALAEPRGCSLMAQ